MFECYGGITTRTENEINQAKIHIEKLIDVQENRLLKSTEHEPIKIITISEYLEFKHAGENSHELNIYKNGLMRGRENALDWVLGNIDDMYELD